MPSSTLSREQRQYVIAAAVDLLRHRNRERVLRILEERLAQGDYPEGQEEEQDLDRIALAIARTIDEKLGDQEG